MDQEYVACLLDGIGPTQVIKSFQQGPDDFAEWITSPKERFPQHRLLIALEQSRGALMAGFAELELLSINSKQLASYRDALYPSCGKRFTNSPTMPGNGPVGPKRSTA